MADGADSERSALLAVENDARESRELSGSSSSATLYGEAARDGNVKERPFPWPFAISMFILVCMIPIAFELIFPFVSEY